MTHTTLPLKRDLTIDEILAVSGAGCRTIHSEDFAETTQICDRGHSGGGGVSWWSYNVTFPTYPRSSQPVYGPQLPTNDEPSSPSYTTPKPATTEPDVTVDKNGVTVKVDNNTKVNFNGSLDPAKLEGTLIVNF